MFPYFFLDKKEPKIKKNLNNKISTPANFTSKNKKIVGKGRPEALKDNNNFLWSAKGGFAFEICDSFGSFSSKENEQSPSGLRTKRN